MCHLFMCLCVKTTRVSYFISSPEGHNYVPKGDKKESHAESGTVEFHDCISYTDCPCCGNIKPGIKSLITT